MANTRAIHQGEVRVEHQAYAFSCMNCGHGWERGYDVNHFVDASGLPRVVCTVEDHVIPSPLVDPRCERCGGTHVRVLQGGRVDGVLRLFRRHPHRRAHRRRHSA